MFNQFHPNDPVSTMFDPTTSFWGTTLGEDISEFGSTSAISVSSMDLTPTGRREFPYIMLSHLLGISLNIPSSQVMDNAHHATKRSILST